MNKILVIGAGVTGLCTAYYLARKGVQVTVIDRNFAPSSSPSRIEEQIIRPFYLEQTYLGYRFENALHSWKEIFDVLQENFFQPRGVIALSFEKGDWADRCADLYERRSLYFRYVDRSDLANIMGAFDLTGIRYGLFSELAGTIKGDQLVNSLRKYLTEIGVEFIEGTAVRDGDCEVILADGNYKGGRVSGEIIIVTGGQQELMPEAFGGFSHYRSYVAYLRPNILNLNLQYKWQFTPPWVDLGGKSNLWGLATRGQNLSIKIGAGIMTHTINSEEPLTLSMKDNQEVLLELYRPYLSHLTHYEIMDFHAVDFFGRESGEFSIQRDGRFVGIAGDCGHGFKFAAENAKYLVEAIDTESFGHASRKLRGEFAATHLR